MRRLSSLCVLIGTFLLSLSCNKPFQPEVQYTPELNVYSVLYANANTVYVRVASVEKSPSDVSQSIHGASVKLINIGSNGTAGQIITLADTTALIDGTSASFYYAPVHVVPGGLYSVSVAQNGYSPVSADVRIPFGYATIPDQNTYSILQNPKDVKAEISLTVNLSGLASAVFVQMSVECRGLDSSGTFDVASYNVLPIDSLNPFTEIEDTTLQVRVDTTQYKSAFKLASLYATSMKNFHLYVVIIVTQIDDNLYRFFTTSTRTATPLLMRTDKIIFTDIFNNAGTGIISGASIDTTRIYLY